MISMNLGQMVVKTHFCSLQNLCIGSQFTKDNEKVKRSHEVPSDAKSKNTRPMYIDGYPTDYLHEIFSQYIDSKPYETCLVHLGPTL